MNINLGFRPEECDIVSIPGWGNFLVEEVGEDVAILSDGSFTLMVNCEPVAEPVAEDAEN